MNPNPVLRVNDSNILIYANPASEPILKPFNIREGDGFP